MIAMKKNTILKFIKPLYIYIYISYNYPILFHTHINNYYIYIYPGKFVILHSPEVLG